jgi:transposase InsO family protein
MQPRFLNEAVESLRRLILRGNLALTLECELLGRTSFKTQAKARMAVFDLIERWYNPHRRHSALDYLSPIYYERSLLQETLYRSPTSSTESE